jgi:DNA transformation protein
MSEFVMFLHEVFEEFGDIRARRMFGGYGIYHDGVMFGLVAADRLYLKTNDSTRAAFISMGLGPFEYKKKGKTIVMSYYLAPEEIFEDRDKAAHWARLAHRVALEASQKSRGNRA